MKTIITLMILLTINVLSGCSSQPKVNFFAKHITKAEADKINATLTASDFDIYTSIVEFPASIESNTIVYTPNKYANEHIELLISLLKTLGYDIQSVNLLASDNHSFTANNIGLYLLPDNFVPDLAKSEVKEHTMQLANEYGSAQCASFLDLKEDNRFVFEVNIWQEQQQDYQSHYIKGTWQSDEFNNLLLSSENWRVSLPFKRTFSIEDTVDGKRQLIKLVPQYNSSVHGSYLKPGVNQVNINCMHSIGIAL